MRPEDRLRARCRLFLQGVLMPPCYFTAIEHGQKLRGTKEERARAWGRLKAQGIKTGLADLFVWATERRFIAIELKVGSNTTSDAQDVFGAAMVTLGHPYEVCYSVEQVGQVLERHDVPLAAGWREIARGHDAALAVEAPRKSRGKGPVGKKSAHKPTRRQVSAGNRMALLMARGPNG